MFINKWLRLMVCIMLAAGILSGCANVGNSEIMGDKRTIAGKQPIKLVMWGGVPPEAGPQKVVDDWNRSNPNIQVEYIRFVNDDDGNLKLDTALLTGQNVDLYVNYSLSQARKRVDVEVALDLSQFTDYDIKAKMGPGAEQWKVEGKYYGIPTKKNSYFIALNKEALEAANLPIPQSWTWDEMRQYAKKLKSTGKYGLLQHLETFVDPIDSVLVKEGYSNETGQSNLDHPIIKKWLLLQSEMMFLDKTTPPYGEQLITKMPVENMFLSGEAAMLVIGEWLIRSANNMRDFPRDFTITFAPMPRLTENDSDFTTRGGLGDFISINPKSEHIEAAWQFLKWYSDGGMTPLAIGGRLPASNAVDRTEAMNQLLAETRDTYDVKALEYVIYGNATPTFVRSVPQQVFDLRTQEYERYFLGDQSLQQTLDNMIRRHNQFLTNH